MHDQAEFDIDEALFSDIRPLSSDEYSNLVKAIEADGQVLTPLVIWKEENLLVDGRHRHLAATQLGLPVQRVYRSFANREAVKLWIWQHHAGRRNQTAEEIRLSRAKILLAIEKSDPEATSTAQAVARASAATGAARRTLYRDKAVAKAREAIPQDVAEMIDSKEVGASQETIVTLAALPEDQKDAACELVRNGQATTLKDALRHVHRESLPDADAAPAVNEPSADVQGYAALKDWNAKIDQALLEIDKALRLMPSGPHLPSSVMQDFRALRVEIKNARGRAVCQSCKGIAGVMKICTQCKKTGFVV